MSDVQTKQKVPMEQDNVNKTKFQRKRNMQLNSNERELNKFIIAFIIDVNFFF